MGRQIHVDLERTIPAPPARVHAARLRLSPVWEGHGGLGGFFERTFAPRGLRRIHGELLDNLTRRLGAEPARALDNDPSSNPQRSLLMVVQTRLIR